ncbi:MAG TPA: hypothetical protein VGQ42_07610 [Candidatus Dormibacteraeota bacterium]|jgi:hypothetical protein|nr:hypothetical protein [Candidatus Dormibacteraeota bacterium]
MLSAALCAGALSAVAFTPASALADDQGGQQGRVIYDAMVRPQPGNLPSQAFEATSTSEFGDLVSFAGTARALDAVTVTMSSWGCQSGAWYSADCATRRGATFSVPVTFSIYAAPTGTAITPGALLATRTQTFHVPYRPSSDNAHCPGGPGVGGQWFDGATCFNGLASTITFDFSAQHVVLPGSVVYGIAYNTSHYGYHPIGQNTPCYTTSGGCPYDSLNVGLSPAVVVGSQVVPGTAFLNAHYAGPTVYCDSGGAGLDVFRLDSPGNACWTGYVPATRFIAHKLGDGRGEGGGSGGDPGSRWD